MKKRKIAIVTGTRAEYGLLHGLMREIQQDNDLELQIIATAMHLSPEFGSTYRLIEADGFDIHAKVEMLLSSDTAVGVTKSMGLCLISLADTLARLSPDLLVLLGDRVESLAAAQAALVQRIPIAHLHGGELSLGAIDDAIRHSITKMSHLHFVAAEPYRKRVIQLGEDPLRVFNVGAPGIERISKMHLLGKAALQKKLGFKLGKLNFLITYHPATLKKEENQQAVKALFSALNQFPEARLIFTKANADEAGRSINQQIDTYVSKNTARAAAFITLGELNYLSLLQYVDVMIGNSSSGLIEAPYFGLPTVNIGSRQKNRLQAASVIDSPCQHIMIVRAIQKGLSPAFQASLKNLELVYKKDNTAKKIKSIIKKTDLKKILLKRFHEVQA